MGKSTVDKFFNRQPIQLSSFKQICVGLRIEDWHSVAELEPIVAQTELDNSGDVAESNVAEALAFQSSCVKQVASRQIIVSDQKNGEVRFEIILKGDIVSIDDQVQKTLETIFRSLSGNTITITDIQAGSIRITLQGSPGDAAKLIDKLTSGELTEINGFPVEDIQILNSEFLEELEEKSFNQKWDLVREIVSHPMLKRQLREVDLSDSNLQGAYLTKSDLRDANLTNVDFRGADLSDANLTNADLRGADFPAARRHARHLSRKSFVLPRTFYFAFLAFHLAYLAYFAFHFAYFASAALTFVSALAFILVPILALYLAFDRDREIDRTRRALDRALDREIDCNQRTTNLSSTNLSGANLSKVDLGGVDLSTTNLSGAIVENTLFGEGIGLTESEKRDLRRRGAIFDESTGDRSSISSSVR